MDHRYPDDVRFQMDRMFPGIVVPDIITNVFNYCLVSSNLKTILKKEASAEIEFLLFILINHKGRIADKECYIANVIGTEDCVDASKTVALESKLRPGAFSWLTRLFLDNQKINPEAKLFRLHQMPNIMIIRSDLRDVLNEHGIRGVKYIAMGQECALQ